MKMPAKHRTAALLAATFLAIGAAHAAPLAAQSTYPFSVDIRGGYGVPFGDFGDAAGSDWGFGAGAVLSLTPAIGVYGGWGRDTFTCDVVGCNGDDRVRLSGFEGGAKFILPMGGRWHPWARAGVIYHRLELDGGIVDWESDRQLGFQGAIGVDFPLGDVLSVTPALRMHILDFDDADLLDDAEIRYFSFDIGAHIHFPR